MFRNKVKYKIFMRWPDAAAAQMSNVVQVLAFLNRLRYFSPYEFFADQNVSGHNNPDHNAEIEIAKRVALVVE